MDASRADEFLMPEGAAMSPVHAENLRISYGKVDAVRGIDLDVRAGEVVGLLGGNGAGKSSTLRAISGVNPPTSGTLVVAGYDMASAAQAEAAQRVVGYTPDVGGLVRQATPREHIALALSCRGRQDEMPYALELLNQFGLDHVADRDTSGFSHGMSRRLSVLLAALTAQKVLALDEPFDGVDPIGVSATKTILKQAQEAGIAVLISTHLLPLLVDVSDRIIVMREGTLVTSGPPDLFAGRTGEMRYDALLRGTAT